MSIHVRLHFTVCFTCITMHGTNKEPWTLISQALHERRSWGGDELQSVLQMCSHCRSWAWLYLLCMDAQPLWESVFSALCVKAVVARSQTQAHTMWRRCAYVSHLQNLNRFCCHHLPSSHKPSRVISQHHNSKSIQFYFCLVNSQQQSSQSALDCKIKIRIQIKKITKKKTTDNTHSQLILYFFTKLAL